MNINIGEIKELDFTKYLVLKREDIDNELSPRGKINLASMQRIIGNARVKKGKKYTSLYLVLNIDDEIDITWLSSIISEKDNTISRKVYVRDIAVDMVNAILKAKGD